MSYDVLSRELSTRAAVNASPRRVGIIYPRDWGADYIAEHGRLIMKTGKSDEQYSPEETARRRDEAIRRALNTPPKPQKEIAGRSGRPPRKRPPERSGPIKKK